MTETLNSYQTINATEIDAIVEAEAANIDAEWEAVSAKWTAQVREEMGNSFPSRELVSA